MTLNRMTVLIAVIFLTVAAAIGVAAAAGGSSSPGGSTGRLLPNGSTALLPWQAHQRALDRPVYHPHQMCDEVRHPAMKQDPRS